jgi:hypothetical protein
MVPQTSQQQIVQERDRLRLLLDCQQRGVFDAQLAGFVVAGFRLAETVPHI